MSKARVQPRIHACLRKHWWLALLALSSTHCNVQQMSLLVPLSEPTTALSQIEQRQQYTHPALTGACKRICFCCLALQAACEHSLRVLKLMLLFQTLKQQGEVCVAVNKYLSVSETSCTVLTGACKMTPDNLGSRERYRLTYLRAHSTHGTKQPPYTHFMVHGSTESTQYTQDRVDREHTCMVEMNRFVVNQ
jgi:hypothetical protein